MNDKLLEIRKKAENCLGETRIADGEAEINKILIDLAETDEQDLDMKSNTLDNIHNYLFSKSKLKLLNSDLTFLQHLSNRLKCDYKKTIDDLTKDNDSVLTELLDIIKRNY